MTSQSLTNMEIIRLGSPNNPPVRVQPGKPFPLPVLPGEHWTTFRLIVDGEPHAVFQVETLDYPSLNPVIEADRNGILHVRIQGHKVLRFAPDAVPSIQPLKVDKSAKRVDIAWVIDATQAGLKSAQSEKKKETQPARTIWESHVTAMAELIDAMGSGTNSGREARTAVLGFADGASGASSGFFPDGVNEKGRRHSSNIAYLTKPERAFRPMDGGDLKKLAGEITRIDGNDYVDALGEALNACVGLAWNGDRRIVVVSGDSPGYSLAFPPPEAGVDTGHCRRDVDAAAMALHELGVEIVTAYLPMADIVNPPSRIAGLLAWTQEQYKRLASAKEYAFTVEAFTSEVVLQTLENAPEAIGRSSAI
uniref:Uncharacterized protein n=1 Tax=Candidatus Kentrum sp. DK TaxID=2126562 RepID=A0A450SCJ1_9GAMM|nr:MAG: hypothetical protein BECKDK2373C_GA0170839_102726 [Candidatus Kentron sp. DK]